MHRPHAASPCSSLVVYALASALFALGGCSDDDAGSDGSTSASTSSASSGGGASTTTSSSASSTTTSGSGGGGEGGTGGTGGTGGGGGAGGGAGGSGGAGGGGLGFMEASSYDASVVFANYPVVYVPTGIAWDGTNLWVSGDGNLGGFTSVRYAADGSSPQSFNLSFGFTNIFTKGDGVPPLFGRALTTNVVEVQQTPTQWSGPYSLAGPSAPVMASFAWDDDADEHVSLYDDVVHRWDAAGAALPGIPLVGFGDGTVAGEASYPQDRRVVVAYGHYLTCSDGVLSAWSKTGQRVATTVLNGAGTADFESAWSFSFAQGKVWVVDSSVGNWRGYVISP